MFPPYSIEQKLAVALCVLVPYLAMYLLYRLGKLWPLNFGAALFVFVPFVASLVLMSVFLVPVFEYQSGPISPRVSIDQAMPLVAIVFPGLPILIVPSFLGLLSWKSDARYFFIALSGFGHLFYLINVVMFMLNIDLIKI